jgi:hypothetical protein
MPCEVKEQARVSSPRFFYRGLKLAGTASPRGLFSYCRGFQPAGLCISCTTQSVQGTHLPTDLRGSASTVSPLPSLHPLLSSLYPSLQSLDPSFPSLIPLLPSHSSSSSPSSPSLHLSLHFLSTSLHLPPPAVPPLPPASLPQPLPPFSLLSAPTLLPPPPEAVACGGRRSPSGS